MPEQFKLLTEKMRYLFLDIVGALGQLPLERRAYLFGYPGEEDTFWINLTARYIIMEYIRLQKNIHLRMWESVVS